MSFGAVCEHEPRNASNAADKYVPIHLSTPRKIQGTRHACNNQVSLIKFHSHVIHAEFFPESSYTHLGCQLLTGNFDISLVQHDFHLPQTQIQITNGNLPKERLGMVTKLSFACFRESKILLIMKFSTCWLSTSQQYVCSRVSCVNCKRIQGTQVATCDACIFGVRRIRGKMIRRE
jgi:hypothetical protein